MKEEFLASFEATLSQTAAVDDLVDVVLKFKEAGLGQADCEEALTELRARLHDTARDLIDVVLTYVVGWCRPELRIWGPYPRR